MNTSDLIDALLTPETYPHPVELITTIETHISIVFLTGHYAYKLKKPVNFGFLDFSSLSKRYHFCRMEVSLNQRTAPELYLGVHAILPNTAETDVLLKVSSQEVDDTSPLASQNSTSPIDYLVKMRQFNPNHVLGRLLNQPSLSLEWVTSLSQQLVEFHNKAERVAATSSLGEPETQLQPMLDNFTTLQDFFSATVQQKLLKDLSTWTQNRFAALKPLLIQRKQQGFIRACHGDLHLDNIALINEHPVMFDGIEFNEDFRWIDVMSDLAFLLIDLEHRNHPATSYQVLALYLNQTLDFMGLQALNLYRVYRTLVRAKITALRAQQVTDNPYQQAQIKDKAWCYVEQAQQYTQQQTPKCIVLHGLSGAGKSYFAQQLNTQLPQLKAIVLSSDRIRKSLLGVHSLSEPSQAQQAHWYSHGMNQKTYQALEDAAQTCLNLGYSVIIDATCLKKAHRNRFKTLSQRTHAQFYIIALDVSTSIATQSIQRRLQERTNPSDATTQVMHSQVSLIEPPKQDEQALVLNVEQLRKMFPLQQLQEYLNLPLN